LKRELIKFKTEILKFKVQKAVHYLAVFQAQE